MVVGIACEQSMHILSCCSRLSLPPPGGPQAIILEADEPAGRCLAIENEVSCASTNNPGQPVCAWGNVLLQPCTLIDEAATLDQKWVHDNATGVIMPVGSRLGLGANLCMTMCTDDNFANGACGLVRNNVGAPCVMRCARLCHAVHGS